VSTSTPTYLGLALRRKNEIKVFIDGVGKNIVYLEDAARVFIDTSRQILLGIV
jgi:hypothetical protein